MALSVLQNSFLGGELAPAMYGRMDDALYKTGLAKLENFLIKPTGVLAKRPGFKFVYELDNSKYVRLIPFRFASDQTLVLIFSDHKLEFATEGAMVMSGSQPYSIESPYSSEDLKELEFSQNADVVTFTNRMYPPMELRRYGATDWRFEACTFSPEIKPPTNVMASAKYPSGTDVEDKGVIEAKYVVTSVDKDNKESLPSSAATVMCNYYLNGGTVIISWRAAANAESYRVYREVCGVYGFLGETESLSLTDEGLNPDTAVTPPKYEVAFMEMSGIKSVEVIDGGENYGTPIQSGVITSETRIPFPWGTASMIYALGEAGSSDQVWPGFFEEQTVPETVEVVFELLDAGSNKVSECKFILDKQYEGGNQIRPSQDVGRWAAAVAVYFPEERNRSSRNIVFSDLSAPVTNPRLRIREGDKYVSGEIWESSWVDVVTKSKSYTTGGNGDPNTGTDRLATISCSFPSIYSLYCHNYEDELAPSTASDISTLDYASTSGYVIATPYPTEINDIVSNNPDLFSGPPPAVMYKAATSLGVSISEWLEAADKTTLDTAIGEDDVEIQIDDPTGSGAVLQATVQEGKIVSVTVVESGKNYTNPVLTVISKSGTGHGAVLKATLYTEDDFDYPAANTQYDQRRIFAGTNANPLKVWMTNAGKQDLMMYHKPILSDDRINVVAVTNDADRVKHAIALESLILFTSSSELRVFAQNSDALSPNSVAVRVQSYIGANSAQPVIANDSIVYVAARGGHPRQISYSYSSSGYTSDDIGIRAPHLFDNLDITDLSLSKAPIQTIWAVSTSGMLLTCIYMPEQQIVGWGRVVTDGSIEGVCSVSEGFEDHVYVIVVRTINGVKHKYLERMDEITVQAEHARHLDSFLEAVFTSPQSTVGGLTHLEGEEVAVFVDGVQQSNKTVKDGAITLDKPGYEIAVGLPFTSRIVTLPTEYASSAITMEARATNSLSLRYKGSGDIWSGVYPQTPYDKIYFNRPVPSRDAIQNDEAKVIQLSIASGFDYQSQVLIESRNSYPLEIISILNKLEYNYTNKTTQSKSSSNKIQV